MFTTLGLAASARSAKSGSPRTLGALCACAAPGAMAPTAQTLKTAAKVREKTNGKPRAEAVKRVINVLLHHG
jgi:hypothetical protein